MRPFDEGPQIEPQRDAAMFLPLLIGIGSGAWSDHGLRKSYLFIHLLMLS
jgi:hypothetical protein